MDGPLKPQKGVGHWVLVFSMGPEAFTLFLGVSFATQRANFINLKDLLNRWREYDFIKKQHEKRVPSCFKSSDYKSVGDTTHPTCGCKSSAAAAAWWQRAPFFLLRYVKCFASGSISKHTGEQRDYICGGCCFCTCLITMSVLYLCVEWTVHY